jgi:hypothetical protein
METVIITGTVVASSRQRVKRLVDGHATSMEEDSRQPEQRNVPRASSAERMFPPVRLFDRVIIVGTWCNSSPCLMFGENTR